MRWQWHQLDYMHIICTMPVPHQSQAGCSSCNQPTASKHWRQTSTTNILQSTSRLNFILVTSCLLFYSTNQTRYCWPGSTVVSNVFCPMHPLRRMTERCSCFKDWLKRCIPNNTGCYAMKHCSMLCHVDHHLCCVMCGIWCWQFGPARQWLELLQLHLLKDQHSNSFVCQSVVPILPRLGTPCCY